MQRHTDPSTVCRTSPLQILIPNDADGSNEAADEEVRAIYIQYGRIGGLRALQLFLATHGHL